MQSTSLDELLQASFSEPLPEAFLEAVKRSQYKYFEVGEFIPLTIAPQSSYIVLVEGRLRALYQNSLGINATLFNLDAGSIIKPSQLLKDSNISLIGSQKGLICFISSEILDSVGVLKNSYLATSNKFKEQIKILADTSTDTALNGNTQAKETNIIEQVLELYNLSAIENEDDTSAFTQLDEVEEELKKYGFKPERLLCTISEVKQNDYPLVLEDKKGQLHLITSITGKNLVKANHTELPLGDTFEENKFAILKIENKNHDNTNAEAYSLTWYLKLFKLHWMLTGQVLLSAIFVQIFALGMPFFYMVIFDRVFGHQNLSTLDIISFGMVLLMVFDLVIKSLQSYIMSHKLEAIDQVSSETLISKLSKIPISKINSDKTRSFSEAFTKLVSSNQILSSSILLTSIEVSFSLFVVIILMSLHFQLTLISLAPLIPIFAYTLWSSPQVQERAMKFAKNQRECQVKLSEILENTETVKSINAGRFLSNNLNEKIKTSFQQGFLSRYDGLSSNNVVGFITTFGSLVVLYYGAHEVIKGHISYGIYLAINMLSRNVMGSWQKAFSTVLKLREASDNLKKLQVLCKEDEDFNTQTHKHSFIRPSLIKGALEIHNLSFRYSTESPWIFQDLNLKIQPGEKIILTGKSGSGKTTLIRLLQRLYEPNEGYIQLDKYNIADIDVENLRKHIGVSIQKPALFAGTVKDNIALGKPYASMQEITEAAQTAQLDTFLLKTPNGYDTPVMPMGVNLSGGQAALITLARLFLLKPSLLIIDETLSPLDSVLKVEVLKAILNKYKNSTCIFITDFIYAHKQADRILVLEKGNVIEQGSYEELIACKGYYHHLYKWSEDQ